MYPFAKDGLINIILNNFEASRKALLMGEISFFGSVKISKKHK